MSTRQVLSRRCSQRSRYTSLAGEQLTERQLLEALLIPSGNNIARMLAALLTGSETSFLAEMNAEARALGMDHTIYTDPSGFDPGTVSTAIKCCSNAPLPEPRVPPARQRSRTTEPPCLLGLSNRFRRL